MSSSLKRGRHSTATSPAPGGRRNSESIKSRGKRKLSDTNDNFDVSSAQSTPSRAGKKKEVSASHLERGQSIKELLASQQSEDTADDTDGHPAKRRSVAHTPESIRFAGEMLSTQTSASSAPRSFAEMYNFTKSAGASTQQNGLVDLTKSPTAPKMGLYNGLRKVTFNPHQGPKKLLVKNIKTAPREDKEVFFERKWLEQSEALDKLFEGDGSKLLLEELYKSAEYICRQGLSKELYLRLKNKCVGHLSSHLMEDLRTETQSASSLEAVKAFVGTWTLWQNQLQTVRHIYFYLNQTYLLRSSEDPDLELMALQLFRSIVFQDETIQRRVLEGVVGLIDMDRDTKSADSSHEVELAKQAISAFHDLGIYTSDFEPVFVSTSKDYFMTWRNSDAQSADLAYYVRSCSELIEREMTRCDRIGLDGSTKSQLSDTFTQIAVQQNLPRLTEEDALLDMFEENQVPELEQTYTLLRRENKQQELSTSFAKFIETEGSVIVFDEKRESEMVVRLLEFKRKLDHLNKVAFHDNEVLGNAMHKAFEVFMNKTRKTQSNWDTDNSKPGEMIAKHLDLLLKGGPRAVPGLRKADNNNAEDEPDLDNDADDDAAIEQHLGDALALFRFVQGKAVFEAFYKKDLARRLLMGRTQSFDAERSMLTRLKNECGAGFTHNLESMFKDMELAREEMSAYNQRLNDRGARPVPDLSVNVLSVAAWPTYPDVPVNLPTLIAKAQNAFENHYKEKHTGRKLTWKPALAHCQLRSRFAKGNKEIVVSGFQAIVLLLFNEIADDARLSYAEIKSASALPDAELIRTLQSLACAKYRVLIKHPKGRDVNPTDSFTFNAAFTDPKMRIKINQIQLKETKEENKETHERVAADRHYETQAAIVRIMKGKKVVGHNELIVEVIKATRSRGVLDQSDIKKNIEKLIEKEYMERDEEMKNGYRYLA